MATVKTTPFWADGSVPSKLCKWSDRAVWPDMRWMGFLRVCKWHVKTWAAMHSSPWMRSCLPPVSSSHACICTHDTPGFIYWVWAESVPAHVGIITSLKRQMCVYYAIYQEKYMGTMQCIVTNLCINVQRIFFLSKRNNIAATMYWCQRQMLVLYFVHSNIGNIWPLKCVCHLCVCVFKVVK